MTTAAAPARTPVIEVEDLVTYYGSRKILKGVNLTVYEGEVMVIMGGSGSGKSTLLRHLLAAPAPWSSTSCGRRWGSRSRAGRSSAR
jgi:phospholipid/cholesterol/gamma-HCH transport system ATP-binding protein